MQSEFNGSAQADARTTIIRCQEDLWHTCLLADAANLLRDALQAFLGANSDLERIAEKTAHSPERDSNGVPVFHREEIECDLLAFWNCLDAVDSAIQNLPADLVSELKSLTSDNAWASRLHQAVHAIEQPWTRTRHCRKYPTDAVHEFVQLSDRINSIRIRNALAPNAVPVDDSPEVENTSGSTEAPTSTTELAEIRQKTQRKKRTDEQKQEARKAAELMSREGKTLSEIANALGYASASGVSKLLNGK